MLNFVIVKQLIQLQTDKNKVYIMSIKDAVFTPFNAIDRIENSQKSLLIEAEKKIGKLGGRTFDSTNYGIVGPGRLKAMQEREMAIRKIEKDATRENLSLAINGKAIAIFGVTTFNIGSAASNLSKAVVKLPFAVLLTIPHLIQSGLGKELTFKNCSLAAVIKHAFKTVAFAALSLLSPFVGLFSKTAMRDLQNTLELDHENGDQKIVAKIKEMAQSDINLAHRLVEGDGKTMPSALDLIKSIDAAIDKPQTQPFVDKLTNRLGMITKIVKKALEREKIAKANNHSEAVVETLRLITAKLTGEKKELMDFLKLADKHATNQPEHYINIFQLN